MATLHANSAREALVKLCTLPMLAGVKTLTSIFYSGESHPFRKRPL